jgi:hypothetical protein
MSLSAEQAGFSRNPSGKTPPPAPSAAFAKRSVVYLISSLILPYSLLERASFKVMV